MIRATGFSEWITDKLDAAVPPPPSSGVELVEYAGGRRELVRIITGKQGPPARADYTDDDAFRRDRRTWSSATNRVRRYATGARRTASLSEAERGRALRAARDARPIISADPVAVAMRASMPGDSPPSTVYRWRTLPAGGPAVIVPGEVMSTVTAAAAAGDDARAYTAFVEGFLEAYGAPDVFPKEVDWIKVSPL